MNANGKERDTTEYRLLLNSKEKFSYDGRPELELTVTVIRMEEGKVRNCTDAYRLGAAYDDLTLHSWLYAADEGKPCLQFGYRQAYHVDLRRAEVMVKTLKTIHAKWEKMNNAEGYAATIGAEVNRFARAIGAEYLMVYRYNSPSSNYDDSEFQSHSLGTMGAHVDWLVESFKAKHNKPAADAASN